MPFADLKKKSNAQFELLQQQLEKGSNKQYTEAGYATDQFWKPSIDESGNGYAVIRFLPPPDGEDLPMVEYFKHNFKSPSGLWFVENCPTTHGDPCPVCEANRPYYATKQEDQIAIARPRTRKTSFVSNIYVIKDPAHPENEGKVFLYKYGKTIAEKIRQAQKPEFADETPVKVFNFWEGANFKIKIRQKGGYWNYDPSGFDSATALSADDDELEAIYNQLNPLQPFVDKQYWKSYDELQAKFLEVTEGRRAPAKDFYAEEESQVPTPSPSYSEAPSSSTMMDTIASGGSVNEVDAQADDAMSFFMNKMNSLADDEIGF